VFEFSKVIVYIRLLYKSPLTISHLFMIDFIENPPLLSGNNGYPVDIFILRTGFRS